jgi:hypothetical protein
MSKTGKRTPSVNRPHDDDVTDIEEVTPSWFSRGIPPDKAESLANRYREARADSPVLQAPDPEAYESYRRRLEERFQSARRMAHGPTSPVATMHHDAPPGRPSLASDEDGNLRFREWQKKVQSHRQAGNPSSSKGRITRMRIAGLFAAACTIGGLAGLGSANTALLTNSLSSGAGSVKQATSQLVASAATLLQAWKRNSAGQETGEDAARGRGQCKWRVERTHPAGA